MTAKERIQEVLEKCLRFASADQTEVVVTGQDTYLTRYATNYIHQNTAETDTQVSVRSVFGKKIGLAQTNALDDAALKRTIEHAERIAKVQPDLLDFLSLPSKDDAGEITAQAVFSDRTAASTAEERARAVGRITALSVKNGFDAAGAFSTAVVRFGIANSLGIRRYTEATRANLTAVVMGPTGSGYAEGLQSDVGKMAVDRVAETAVGKCRDAQNPVAVEPGDYEVILEPAAVADMIQFLAYMGLGALALQEGRSFMSGRIGQKVTGENFTLWDDGTDPAGMAIPFDFEGVRRQKVMLIEKGVAKSVVYDSYTAGREPGKKSTGHALPPSAQIGALPLNLFMKPGDAEVEDLIKATKRGILVTRFHYTNPLHPVLTTITGMTRDGTFLVENGKVKSPIKNMRFTNGILDAFDAIEAIGKRPALVDMFGLGVCSAPAVKLKKFSFTGGTEH